DARSTEFIEQGHACETRPIQRLMQHVHLSINRVFDTIAEVGQPELPSRESFPQCNGSQRLLPILWSDEALNELPLVVPVEAAPLLAQAEPVEEVLPVCESRRALEHLPTHLDSAWVAQFGLHP